MWNKKYFQVLHEYKKHMEVFISRKRAGFVLVPSQIGKYYNIDLIEIRTLKRNFLPNFAY